MSTMTTPNVSVSPPEQELDPPKVAHIIKVEYGQDATVKIMEARINGTPVETLCGVIFVPTRDPRQVPPCEACKSLYEVERAFHENLNENVRD